MAWIKKRLCVVVAILVLGSALTQTDHTQRYLTVEPFELTADEIQKYGATGNINNFSPTNFYTVSIGRKQNLVASLLTFRQ